MELNLSTRSLCKEAGFSETALSSSSGGLTTISESVTRRTADEQEEEVDNSNICNTEDFCEQNSCCNLEDKISALESTVTQLRNKNEELRKLYVSQMEENNRFKNEISLLVKTHLKQTDSGIHENQVTSGMNEKHEKGDQKTIAGHDEPEPIVVLNTQLNALTADFTKVNTKFDLFTAHVNSLSKIVYRLDSDVQKFVKKHSLIIENLCPKEDISAMEMLLVFVNSVLNVPITDLDIENLHIISRGEEEKPGNATPDKVKLARPRPLLVTFTCYKTQSHIYKAWLSFRSKSLTGSLSHERGQGITIKEYLTDPQEEVYNQALKLKEEHLVVDCWTYKGKSYIKKLSGDVCEFCNRNEIVPKTENSSCLVM
ncbi:hypothetical protein HELRODRAFT_182760 [Helobdella robusta]|uniref:Uncharacterized protein n=1 Tax=Helobdella robusta TaxID=6412 RepID=T1FIP4_HELRO|nr:hypothetical protein HELRODRAFT_182760 [Helobdella robusta]ESN90159.1 hypothetical protein HELRODRAFT_182760 [Helobdella robusta]